MSDANVELLPCAWCGGSAVWLAYGDRWTVTCRSQRCPVLARTALVTEEEAITRWNTRPGTTSEFIKIITRLTQRSIDGHQGDGAYYVGWRDALGVFADPKLLADVLRAEKE